MAIGAFAQGLMTGYSTGTQIKQKREMHDMMMEDRQEERDMREAFKKIEAHQDVEEFFTVPGGEGADLVFDNPADALAAAEGVEANVSSRFRVAGEHYNTRFEAEQAQDYMNSPAARAKMMAEVAMSFGRPETAEKLYSLQQTMLDANRRQLQHTFLQARQNNDLDGVLNYMNHQQGPNGTRRSLVRDDTGAPILVTANAQGEVVDQQPFESSNALWDYLGADVAATPDTMLSAINSERQLALQRDTLAWNKQADQARIGIAAGQLGVAQSNLNLSHQKFEHEQSQWRAPSVTTGMDPETGNQTVTHSGLVLNRETGEYEPKVSSAQDTGAPPIPRGQSGGLLDGLNLGAPQPFPDPDFSTMPGAPQGLTTDQTTRPAASGVLTGPDGKPVRER